MKKQNFFFFSLIFTGFILAAPVKDTLHLWVMPNGPGSGETIEKIVSRFEEETKIHVRTKLLDWSEAFDKIQTALRGESDIPDVFQLGTTWISLFASQGLIAPLNSVVNTIDSSRFLNVSWKQAHVKNLPDIFSVPWFLDVRILFGNKNVLNELGVIEGETFTDAEFRGLLNEISERGFVNSSGHPIVPFGIPGKDDWTGPQQLAPWVWGFGGDFVKKENSKWMSALLDSASLKGVARYLYLLRAKHLTPYSLRENSSQVAQRFTGGEQAFLMGTSEIIRKLEIPIAENGLKESLIGKDGIALLPFPEGEKGHFAFVGGSHLAIPKIKSGSINAKKLLQFFVRADNIDCYTRRIGFLPADKSVLNVRAADPRYRHLIKEIEKNGRAFPNIPEWGDIENELINLTNHIGIILRNQQNPKSQISSISTKYIETHQKINQILNIEDTVLVDLSFVETVLFASLPQKTFEFRSPIVFSDSNISLTKSVSKPSRIVIRILVILLIPVCILLFFLGRRLYLNRKKWP